MICDLNKVYARNRFAYIIEAAVEYFITLLVTDAFITNLLVQSGVSDAMTGVIIQLSSFAFVAQLFSVFYRKKRGMKVWVTSLHLINQLLFAVLYMVPEINLPQSIKITVLVSFFLGAHIVSNIVSPYKISWLMSFVPDKSRGRFTANKEIVSLLGGMIFSFVMGNYVDHYMEIENYRVAFTLCAVTIFVMAAIHFVCLISVKDHEHVDEDSKENGLSGGLIESLKQFFGNKGFIRILAAVIIWHIATGISVSFYGSYKIQTLGFSLRDVAILSGISAITRAVFSRPFGKFADKNSWAKLLYMSFIIVSVAYFANIFVIKGEIEVNLSFLKNILPNSSGVIAFDLRKTMFIVYSIIHGISMAGINSGLMNIMFDYVPNSQRSAALGFSNAIGGLVSFFTSILGGFILAYIQNNGDSIFGINVYGQQILSAIAFVVCIILIAYMKFAIVNKKRN